MFDHASVPVLVLLFVGGVAIVWIAGHALSTTTDALDTHFGLGQALGGSIFLAIATNLPEIAITVAASLAAQFDLAIGNILGGIAIQTVVLAVLDFVVMRRKDAPLTTAAASLVIVIQACGLAAILIIAIQGTLMPKTAIWMHLTPATVAIALVWIATLLLSNKASEGLPWTTKTMERQREAGAAATKPLGVTIAIFGAAALATLGAGWILEQTSNALAQQWHMAGTLFGATILAAATSLPELTTGITAVKMGDYELAIGDIIGGNTFLPVLFVLAALISGQAVLPNAHKTDVYLAGLGIVLTMIYAYGAVFRSKRRLLGMGLDSAAVVILYIVGVVGLLAFPR
ncbi:MAG TPA: hypothetical protein VIG46_13470 [Candidatus Baltobacteraceae bacterium]|jgi:cation:H+ antiporter